jgi:hypothetical protein
MATQGKLDDLDAVRTLVDALKEFDAVEQRRIIRWAEEKLGLSPISSAQLSRPVSVLTDTADGSPVRTGDIRAFVQQKQPTSDTQFAAVVAYFYAFEAPESQRKTEIGASDLQEASRLAGRNRLVSPINTLHNAARLGYLDKGGRGLFKVNTVGENLVAMALPGGGLDSVRSSRSKKAGKRATKK